MHVEALGNFSVTLTRSGLLDSHLYRSYVVLYACVKKPRKAHHIPVGSYLLLYLYINERGKETNQGQGTQTKQTEAQEAPSL